MTAGLVDLLVSVTIGGGASLLFAELVHALRGER